MNIGMALSGGGYRATVFHLGVLEWFARMGHLNDVKFLSTVSGGSICAGMVFTVAGNRWPDDKQYRDVVLPQIRKLLMKVDLQRDLLIRAIFSPLELFKTRADDLAELMEDNFDVTGTLQDLPAEPRWIVNTACYETGKLFRLERKRMGDYLLGYVKSPKLRISEAMAASAGFPIGIGPLELRPRDYKWLHFENGKLDKAVDPPAYDTLHLWDGGVYDNLGDEPLFNPGEGWRDGVDFLVVSDASGLFKEQEYQFGVSPLKRLLDISISQARAVRARALVNFMQQNPGSGIFLHTDNTVRSIVDQAQEDGILTKSPPTGALNRVLSDKSVIEAATMSTHIRDLSAAEFDLLFRQGFEVANATYFSYVNQDKWLDYH
jgi:NTE family protein